LFRFKRSEFDFEFAENFEHRQNNTFESLTYHIIFLTTLQYCWQKEKACCDTVRVMWFKQKWCWNRWAAIHVWPGFIMIMMS